MSANGISSAISILKSSYSKIWFCFIVAACIALSHSSIAQLPGASGNASSPNASLKTQNAEDADDSLARARGQMQKGSLNEAEATIRSYLARVPGSAPGHFLLGHILFLKQKPADSLAAYTEGARFQKPGVEDLKIVSFDYVLLQDYAEADKWLNQALAWKPDDPELWYYLGRTKYNENHFNEAIEAFTSCLKLDPKNVKAEDNLGLAYLGLQRDSMAKTAFQTAIELQANAAHQNPQPYLNLGTLLRQQSHPEEGIAYLQKAVELSPKNPKIHEQLGQAYIDLSRLDAAQAEFEKAVSLAPNTSNLHYQLGQVYQKKGLKEQAHKEFARCAELNASHSSEETPNPFD